MSLTIESLTGAAIPPAIPELARLRIEVFRDYPYLYEGDLDYETKYLATYARASDAVVVVARDGARMVGAATGAPMAEQMPAWSKPFAERGYPLDSVFYCGESVLAPAYRGQGAGHAFFDGREAQARRLGARWSCFCAVMRAEDDPRRPSDYRPLDAFWAKRGYTPMDGVVAHFEWKEIGDAEETEHALQFWIREL